MRGDKSDQMLEQYVSDYNLKVPVERISSNKYVMGTNKFQTKIINGKLMVRVGRGFMSLHDYLSKQTASEIEKLKLKTKR